MSVKVMGSSGLVLLLLLLGWSACDGAELPPHVQLQSEKADPLEKFKLVRFDWATVEGSVTHNLTVCTDTTLNEGDDTQFPKYKYTLLYGNDAVANMSNSLGNLTENVTCAVFPEVHDPAGVEVLYILEVQLENNTHVRNGRAALPMTIPLSHEVTNITFPGEGLLYRAVVPQPLPGCYASDDLTICYSDIEVTFDSCYSVNSTGGDTVEVCSDGGPTVTPAGLTPETLTIASLDYGTTSLNVSLETTTPVSIEAIVTNGGGDPFVYVSSDPETVTLAGFAPSYTVYGVTLVGLDNSAVPTVVGESSITDLNVLVFNDPPLLEFGFRNADPQIYTATLEEESQEHGTAIDCSDIPTENTCFGFFQHDTVAGDVVVEVKYANETNAIRALYNVQARQSP